LQSSTTPLSFEAPPRGTPANIRIYLIFLQSRVIGLHLCRCKCGCIFIQICAVASGLQKVIQGRSFWCQSKARIGLPISPSLLLWSYFAPFLRCGDFLAENCLFFLPLSHSAPPLPMFPLEFCSEETTVMGPCSSEDRMIVAGVVLTQCQRVTDVQADRRTDGRTDERRTDLL